MEWVKVVICATIVAVSNGPTAIAREIDWRPAISQQVGFGHCAKGPCMRRASFGARAHRSADKGGHSSIFVRSAACPVRN